MKLKAGSRLGPFKIVAELGRGGMGTVYRAFQPTLERNVAIKVLPAFFAEDAELRARFKREAVTIAKLDHPAIVQVYEYGEQSGRPYIVMALVEGGSLADRPAGPMPLAEAAHLLVPLAAALDYAHGRGVLHRDVKASNTLLRPDRSPLLTDFGLARSVDADAQLTQSGALIGTPEYMAPELWLGKPASPATDQYALAVMAYELLAGKPAFGASTWGAAATAHAELDPDFDAVPESARGALKRALAKSPQDRFTTCTEFVEALSKPTPAPVTVEEPSVIRNGGSRWQLIAAVSAGMVLVGVVAALLAAHSGRSFALPPGATTARVSVISGLEPLLAPAALAVGGDGSLFIADTGNNEVKKVDRAGKVILIAGGGKVDIPQPTNADALTIVLHAPAGLAVDADGNLYIADTGANRVLKLDQAGKLATVAGTTVAGYSGDGGPPTAAQLRAPGQVAVVRRGGSVGNDILIFDRGNGQLRIVTAEGTINTVTLMSFDSPPLQVEPSSSAGLVAYANVAHRGTGFAEGARRFGFIVNTASNQVFRMNFFPGNLSGNLELHAGTGRVGYSGDGGPAASTTLAAPAGIALGRLGDVYIADAGNNRIRHVDTKGVITTVAGGGGHRDATTPNDLQLNAPLAVAVGPDGTVYIADTANNRVIRMAP